jgi:hypothetical protein
MKLGLSIGYSGARLDLRALVGPPERIRSRYRAWENSGNTGLIIRTNQDEAVELMAEMADLERPS